MINKILKFIIVTLWLLQLPLKVQTRHHNRNSGGGGGGGRFRSLQSQQLSNIDVRDKILELQCYAKCHETLRGNNIDYEPCLTKCQIDMIKAPRRGYCPAMQNAIFQNINVQPLQKLSCLDNCSYDFDCPEVQKCCNSACGPVCMQPIGVRDDSRLPPIPKILKCGLIPREQKVEITLESNSSYYFHVEVRYHIGSLLSPRKLGPWQYQAVQKLAEILDLNILLTTVAFYLRPGRWYQVRVAAINAYGFRGYSEPSQAFTLPNHPKPPKAPADLKVVSSHSNGKHVNIKIVWCASKSNLPIEKYKIIWSLYVNNVRDESLISNEAFVKDRHQFEIPNLLPDSSYYIQVQAMSINGKRRLKSDKHSILYNTTKSPTQAFSPLKCGKEHQLLRDGLSNAFNDDRYYTKNNLYNDGGGSSLTSLSSTSAISSISSSTTTFNINNNNSTYNSKAEKFDVKYRPNRKLGMLVIISGLFTRDEK
ncbi:anosmin-1 [Lucilia cuprina]|uniref:anosmin-1 n=1 Tax=Lucilia cuprina TaxID=7375 RepID=UPI001F055FF9|nr:anosmin-1 [Lucilia cuprina]XP_046805062.1 anosmin-1 [Lucilia cuprina]XP_046805063.1 anosmin-1 [Lucilia cuprina]XP_046805064.1 anosmin-1 [Lucilia cuprina]XP_046805065.1 anosmin-1 [Lucilia cuprina]XP_046805066.1 anosmin-1 [Lucilia cuprina]XP_046805067.1 anosmin-1 [Lucilia cuprina]XP_046805068.1 anosmin-1 [Lucilia cuprina]XP_046805069.1 anosmin-1 [Lucilia cuprina]